MKLGANTAAPATFCGDVRHRRKLGATIAAPARIAPAMIAPAMIAAVYETTK